MQNTIIICVDSRNFANNLITKTIDMILQEKIDKITQAFDDYTPEFWRSQNYRFNMVCAIMDNKQYIDDFVGYIEYVEKAKETKENIRATLMHDIGGLMRNDEHFLPRVVGYKNINQN